MDMVARTPAAADALHSQLGGSEDVIPTGMYCYTRRPSLGAENGVYPIVTCPYWARDPDRDAQDNGYCAHIKSGDWDVDGLSLLWDQVKECGVRDDLPEEIE